MNRALFLLPLLALVAHGEDLVFEAFEGDGFGTWNEEGGAFGKGPSAGGPGRLADKVQAWAGASFACSFFNDDSAKGSLTSPEFTIERPYIHFLVGGGDQRDQTSVQLLLDDKVTEEAVGEKDELFRPAIWNVTALKGRKARIRILDKRDGDWGFILADHFVFSDAPAITFPPAVQPKKAQPGELVATPVIPGLTIPAGTYAKVFATDADHQVYSPTSLCLDEQGKVLVAETLRFRFGIEDNRNHRSWVLDDIASDSTAYRRAMYDRFPQEIAPENLTLKTEVIRHLADTDGDGVADVSKVFADSFNNALDGTASGIFSMDGTAYLACIPHIWLLRDKDGDGVAEEKESMLEGFGLRVSLSGHDLNGFTLGPDGRIYGTIGDRGMRVTTREGRELFYQDQGTAFRFDPDGSNFEVVHAGLRNPKEIAFDKWGNAVSVDNNSDQGDGSRLVYITEGADSGWRTDHQNLHTFHQQIGYAKRPIGQWMVEDQWKPRNDLQPAFILPPVANFSNGPSGLTYQPGTGLANDCVDSFLVCDYKGGPAASGIWAFGVAPDGAGMAVVNPRKWSWGTGVTDVEFGFDGKVYVSDFITGWTSHEKGRIYTISSEENDKDPLVAEVATLVREGFKQREPAQLLELLGHADQRVRFRSGLALSSKPEALPLFRLAITQQENRLKRLQGVWGLWMLARRETSAEATTTLVALLGDNDSEVRAQAARALGEAPVTDPGPLAIALRDPSARVRAFAAIALGRLKATDRFTDIVALLAENADKDIYLRHAGVMGLLGCASPGQIVALKDNPSYAVRIAAVVALHRLRHPEIVAFLFDENPRICDEVICAVHNAPIEEARPAIAALLNDYAPGRTGRPLTRMMLRRIVHSAFRLGTPGSAASLLQFASNPGMDLEERLEALRLLSIWENPLPVDQSIGRHMPFGPRDFSLVRSAFETHLPVLLRMDGPILSAAIGLAGQYGLAVGSLDNTLLTTMATDPAQSPGTRLRALDLLAERKADNLEALVNGFLGDQDDAVASRALQIIAELHPDQAIDPIRRVLGSGNDRRRQDAWKLLATLPAPEAASEITRALASLKGSTSYPADALEIIEAAEARSEAEVKTSLEAFRKSLPENDPLGEFRLALLGGDPAHGRELFESHPSAQCMRCHRVDTGHSEGGEAGPNLADIGIRQNADYILRSLVDPNADVADGFGVISVTFHNGTGLGGTLMDETETTMDILSGTDLLRVRKSDLKEQTKPVSAMLPTNQLLTKREMRDLVSWLITLDQKAPEKTIAGEPVLLDPATLLATGPEPAPQADPAGGKAPAAIDPAVMEAGKGSYLLCLACHGADGKGMPGLAPPLANSEWVLGPPENLIRIQLRGLTGPIKVGGQDYTFAAGMPAQAFQTDEQIAAVLTYIRNSFGNAATAVTPDMVAALRGEVGKPALTVADLIPPPPLPAPSAGGSADATPSAPATILDDADDLPGGWPWWGTVLIVLWLVLCLVPLAKQFARNSEDSDE